MSFFTLAELLKGAEHSSRKLEMLRRLDDLARVIPVRYAASLELCRHYAAQFTPVREAGTPIGANDLWIACHALADDCTLVTNNSRAFERVAPLRLENWASRLPVAFNRAIFRAVHRRPLPPPRRRAGQTAHQPIS